MCLYPVAMGAASLTDVSIRAGSGNQLDRESTGKMVVDRRDSIGRMVSQGALTHCTRVLTG